MRCRLLNEWGTSCGQSASLISSADFGILERGVPQAYVRARASSATLCSVHVLRVFLCIFYIKQGIWYASKRAWMHIWYVSKPVPPCHGTPPYDYSKDSRKMQHLRFRKAPDTFNFLRHVMRAIWSVRPKCSHRCVSLKETSLKPVQTLKHTTKNSAEQTAMRTKWFKHIAI